MKLKGSCHCGAVTFSVDSHTPQPYMRCYCSICRKTAGGGGYAVNIMGDTRTLKVRGAKNIAVYARASRRRAKSRRCRRRATLRQMRERAVGLGPALGRMGLYVRVGDRYAVTQAARRRIDHARLRGALDGSVEGSRPQAFSRVPERVDRGLAQEARARGQVGGCGPTPAKRRANRAPDPSPAARRRPNRFSSSSESASRCPPSARRSSARPAGTGECSAGNWETPASPRRAR